jgi:thiamine biosynthesis lipoprotein
LIGIEQPTLEKRDELQVLVPLQNRALATSGNYRNFRIDSLNGIKYSHTLNAFSGWPIETEIKSSTVIGASCALADALATAFLAMPLNQVQSWLENNQEWDAYLIYQNKKGDLEFWSSLEDIYN